MTGSKRALIWLLGWLAWLGSSLAHAAPPEPEPERTELRGRVITAGGSREPVAGAVVMIVDAPAGVRVGRPASEPLDPDRITWMLRVETDAEGAFVVSDVPIGEVRLVIVAGAHARFEQWAAVRGDGDELIFYIEPQGEGYRTEVVSERGRGVEPEHRLDAREARHYAGSGNDPMLAALNLPGVARSPGGLGMLSFRGGDPRETGVYLDHHPIPRAFHVLPIASVVSPTMVDSIGISPGNYAAAYGSFGAGLVEIASRQGTRRGVHGQAHIDLFDVAATVEGPVGDGSVHLGVRRSHVGDLLRATPFLAPTFWDYLARFDHDLGRRHALTVRALGAGDRLRVGGFVDFAASFHRFDFESRFVTDRWRILVSPSLRFDDSKLEQSGSVHRNARVVSFRATFERSLKPALALQFGVDFVLEHWRRTTNSPALAIDGVEFDMAAMSQETQGDQARAGVWFALPLHFGRWHVVPALRGNLFIDSGVGRTRFDPRIDFRVRVHERVELLAALGMYSIPVVLAHEDSTELIQQDGSLGRGVADVPEYLLTYFDPGIQREVVSRSATATRVIHASTGAVVELPWQVELRATGFWREGLPVWIRTNVGTLRQGRRRAFGAELLLRRSLAPGVVDGWIGYTVLSSRVDQRDGSWLPTAFDQRHNFVALLSFALPREFRLGLRFRVVSGNPESPVVGSEATALGGQWSYRPLRAELGTSYKPVFHQLDVRLDKRWLRDRTSVTAYLDVQNVYNRIYPEVWLYSRDWATRSAAIGLPIYPSVGVQIDY